VLCCVVLCCVVSRHLPMTRSTSLGLSKGCATSTGRDSTSTLFASKLLILDSYFTVLNLSNTITQVRSAQLVGTVCAGRAGSNQ
jgi:hypothetical protein